jgi:hypothetical protein
MEVNITKFITQGEPCDYSASVAEIGDNAGKITWSNAQRDAGYFKLLDTEDKIDAFKDHIRGFGAWSEDEITKWSVRDCNALFLQLIAGDMREVFLDDAPDWTREDIGNLFLGVDGQYYYYMGG